MRPLGAAWALSCGAGTGANRRRVTPRRDTAEDHEEEHDCQPGRGDQDQEHEVGWSVEEARFGKIIMPSDFIRFTRRHANATFATRNDNI
jgi:hypothetical protein